jgi:hypothetical protein
MCDMCEAGNTHWQQLLEAVLDSYRISATPRKTTPPFSQSHIHDASTCKHQWQPGGLPYGSSDIAAASVVRMQQLSCHSAGVYSRDSATAAGIIQMWYS